MVDSVVELPVPKVNYEIDQLALAAKRSLMVVRKNLDEFKEITLKDHFANIEETYNDENQLTVSFKRGGISYCYKIPAFKGQRPAIINFCPGIEPGIYKVVSKNRPLEVLDIVCEYKRDNSNKVTEVVYKDGLEFTYNYNRLIWVSQYQMGHLVLTIEYREGFIFKIVKYDNSIAISTSDILPYYYLVEHHELLGDDRIKWSNYYTKKYLNLDDLFTDKWVVVPVEKVTQEFTTVNGKLTGYFIMNEDRGWGTGKYSISERYGLKSAYRHMCEEQSSKIWTLTNEKERVTFCLTEFLACSLPEVLRLISSYMS